MRSPVWKTPLNKSLSMSFRSVLPRQTWLFVLFAALAVSLSVGSAPAAAGVEWRDIARDLEEVLQERSSTNWEGAGGIGSTDARSRRIQRIMNNVVGILSDAPASRTVGQLEALREEIRAEQRRIESLQAEASLAPPVARHDGTILGFIRSFFEKTREDYEDMIASRRARIGDLERNRDALKQTFADELAELGVQVGRDQLDALLSTVTVKGIVDMYAVYENLKSINDQLGQAIESSGESMDVAKRYYGLYAVLIETALYMHQEFLRDIADYNRQLDEIIAETRQIGEQSRLFLRSQQDPQARRVLEANIESQNLTIRAAERYKEYLASQGAIANGKRAELWRRLGLAVNTYRTVMVSSRLLDMMRMQARDFNAIMSIEVPRLRPFESIELQREFERLGERLQAGS